jgi:GT2 family glycosyltransferase
MSTITIATVIVTFNRKAELKKTIEAIKSQGIVEEHIIVVNNNSSDGTEVLLTTDYPTINAFHLVENIASAGGFAKGMQVAFEKGYDWVWLFNDDSRPVKGTLDSVIGHLETEVVPPPGLVKIANKNEQNQAVLLYWEGVRKPKYVALSNELIATDLVTFDGCIISRKLMGKIGFCDPLYFMGTYEFDYCLKAKDVGFGIYTIPNGLIHDEKLGGVGGTPPWRQYYNTRNHLWLAIDRKSFATFKGWFIREAKFTITILLKGDKKRERLLFKFRAIRDAVLNKRGKRYDPEVFRNK